MVVVTGPRSTRVPETNQVSAECEPGLGVRLVKVTWGVEW